MGAPIGHAFGAGVLAQGPYGKYMAVDQASRFEPVVNLKTARAMGFAIPQSILLRADRVIE